ncbi:hypothetical protein HDU92_003169 [Lobulomyces angularis]|nr:hypothetical protein HDU92_003169 [Lobulomyces angularis]
MVGFFFSATILLSTFNLISPQSKFTGIQLRSLYITEHIDFSKENPSVVTENQILKDLSSTKLSEPNISGLALLFNSSCVPLNATKNLIFPFDKKFYFEQGTIGLLNISNSFSCSLESKLKNIINFTNLNNLNLKSILVYGSTSISTRDSYLKNLLNTTNSDFIPKNVIMDLPVYLIDDIITANAVRYRFHQGPELRVETTSARTFKRNYIPNNPLMKRQASPNPSTLKAVPAPKGVQACLIQIKVFSQFDVAETLLITFAALFGFFFLVTGILAILYKKGLIFQSRKRLKERKLMYLRWDQREVIRKYVKRWSQNKFSPEDINLIYEEKQRYLLANPTAKETEIWDHIQAKFSDDVK